MVSTPRPPSSAPEPDREPEPRSDRTAAVTPAVPVTPGAPATPRSATPDPVGDQAGEWGAESAEQPWRIKPVLPVTKGLGAVAVVVLVFAFGRRDPVQWVLAGAVALGLAGWMLRDLVAPVRLAADQDGITVITGFAGRRQLDWADVERLRIDRRERLGLTSSLLEVDTGDYIHLFSMHDLGAEPADVLAQLEDLRAASR